MKLLTVVVLLCEGVIIGELWLSLWVGKKIFFGTNLCYQENNKDVSTKSQKKKKGTFFFILNLPIASTLRLCSAIWGHPGHRRY